MVNARDRHVMVALEMQFPGGVDRVLHKCET